MTPLEFCQRYDKDCQLAYPNYELKYKESFMDWDFEYEGDPETLLNIGLISPVLPNWWFHAWQNYDMTTLRLNPERIMQSNMCVFNKRYHQQNNALSQFGAYIFEKCSIETQMLIGLVLGSCHIRHTEHIPPFIYNTSLILHSFLKGKPEELSKELTQHPVFDLLKEHFSFVQTQQKMMKELGVPYATWQWKDSTLGIDPKVLMDNFTLNPRASMPEETLFI